MTIHEEGVAKTLHEIREKVENVRYIPMENQ